MQEVWIIGLAILGILISGYIAYSHKQNKKVICPINGEGCNEVLNSKWSTMLGIKNEKLGILYYLFAIISAFIMLKGYAIGFILVLAATGAMLFSLFLTVIQIKVLKKFCFYCICTAIINIALFVLLIK